MCIKNKVSRSVIRKLVQNNDVIQSLVPLACEWISENQVRCVFTLMDGLQRKLNSRFHRVSYFFLILYCMTQFNRHCGFSSLFPIPPSFSSPIFHEVSSEHPQQSIMLPLRCLPTKQGLICSFTLNPALYCKYWDILLSVSAYRHGSLILKVKTLIRNLTFKLLFCVQNLWVK